MKFLEISVWSKFWYLKKFSLGSIKFLSTIPDSKHPFWRKSNYACQQFRRTDWSFLGTVLVCNCRMIQAMIPNIIEFKKNWFRISKEPGKNHSFAWLAMKGSVLSVWSISNTFSLVPFENIIFMFHNLGYNLVNKPGKHLNSFLFFCQNGMKLSSSVI